MLRACRRLLRPGGRTAFYTILIPPGLTGRALRRAQLAGPSAVLSRREHGEMLRAAGFVEVEESDVTREYLGVARALLEGRQRHAVGLREAEGETEFDQQLMEKRDTVAAIEAGALRRSLFVARRPALTERRSDAADLSR